MHIGSIDPKDKSTDAAPGANVSSEGMQLSLNDPKSIMLKMFVVMVYGTVFMMLFWLLFKKVFGFSTSSKI